jgi:hypothetical protein
MTVSNSIDVAYTAAQIVTMARRKLGIQAQEEPLEAADLLEGIDELNLMLKEWQTDGVYYWTMTEGTLTSQASEDAYTFQTAGDFTIVPLDIMHMRVTKNSVDLEMQEISREEYFRLPNKATTGFPTCWFYDRQRSTGVLYTWPCADSTSYTFNFTYRRVIMDVDASTDNLDLPQEWYNAIVYSLADRLSENLGFDNQKITLKAISSYEKLKAFNVGEGIGSFTMVPDFG